MSSARGHDLADRHARLHGSHAGAIRVDEQVPYLALSGGELARNRHGAPDIAAIPMVRAAEIDAHGLTGLHRAVELVVRVHGSHERALYNCIVI
jgi:hypothetical protein